MACQHQVQKAKLDYKQERISLETLQEIAKAMKAMIVHINIAFDKELENK